MNIVNIKKVFDALIWLKHNNPLYSHIILSKIHNELQLDKLDNLEFQEIETDAEIILHDKCELLYNPKSQIEKTENNEEVTVKNQQKDMLTQIIDENDGYYEQYTIYPLYEKKEIKVHWPYIKC